ncbi:MAG: hypothetical protein ABJZ55_16145 [Fuerstiella sp.]
MTEQKIYFSRYAVHVYEMLAAMSEYAKHPGVNMTNVGRDERNQLRIYGTFLPHSVDFDAVEAEVDLAIENCQQADDDCLVA